jgi:hypothetical protein
MPAAHVPPWDDAFQNRLCLSPFHTYPPLLSADLLRGEITWLRHDLSVPRSHAGLSNSHFEFLGGPSCQPPALDATMSDFPPQKEEGR